MASAARKILTCVAPRFAALRTKCTCPTASTVISRNINRYNVSTKGRISSTAPKPKKDTVTITFINSDGDKLSAKAKLGDNLLDVMIENDLDLDGFGACEGTLACSTCHLIFKPEHFEKIPDKPTDEELDMLDLAYGLEDTSRLGCQVCVIKDMEGWEVLVPSGVSDARDV